MNTPHFPHAEAPSAALSKVSITYPKGPTVLNALDWQLLPGQVVGLLGRNGAGKTTLLETLLGLREPQSGRVQLFGQDAALIDDATRARIGYVPQSSDLFEGMTAAQLLAYFKSFYPRWNEAKVDGLMSRWDIARDKPIRKLSGGQQQRLSIIRALAHEPDLLVLDEPVASLDPAGRRDFLRELVEQVLDRGTTVVFSTHILSDLERVAFNLAFMSGGKIVLQAPLDELLDTLRLFTGTPAQLAGLSPIRRTAIDAGRERVLARLPDAASLPAGVEVQAVNLEDLFMELT
jgi:ABC-2 type transport system ATP-binding protein